MTLPIVLAEASGAVHGSNEDPKKFTDKGIAISAALLVHLLIYPYKKF